MYDGFAETLASVLAGEQPVSALAGLGPEEMATLLEYGLNQMRAGYNEKAAKTLEVLAKIEDGNPVFTQYLGLAWERAGDRQRALEAYDRTVADLARLRAAPQRRVDAHLLRGNLRATSGDVAGAREDLDATKSFFQGGDDAVAREIGILERAVGGVS
jgi:tetratricopeptide (TPR) repeat protein